MLSESPMLNVQNATDDIFGVIIIERVLVRSFLPLRSSEQATIVTTKEAAFFASRECVNATGSDSTMMGVDPLTGVRPFDHDDDRGRGGNYDEDLSSPSSPPPLPPHGLFVPLDNDRRSTSSHSR